MQETIKDCYIEIIQTAEGLYVSKQIQADQMEEATSEITLKTHLLLAEIDFKSYNIYNNMLSKTNRLSFHNCNTLKSMLHIFETQFNEYMTITEKKVLYNLNAELIINNSEIIPYMVITEKTDQSFEGFFLLYDVVFFVE